MSVHTLVFFCKLQICKSKHATGYKQATFLNYICQKVTPFLAYLSSHPDEQKGERILYLYIKQDWVHNVLAYNNDYSCIFQLQNFSF